MVASREIPDGDKSEMRSATEQLFVETRQASYMADLYMTIRPERCLKPPDLISHASKMGVAKAT